MTDRMTLLGVLHEVNGLLELMQEESNTPFVREAKRLQDIALDHLDNGESVEKVVKI